jgi:hypothetical protein
MRIRLNFSKANRSAQSAVTFLHRIGRDAYLDWQLQIVFSFIVGAALLVVGYFSFSKADNLQSSQANMKTGLQQASSFNVKTLNDVMEFFDGRATESANIITNYSGPTDPSI